MVSRYGEDAGGVWGEAMTAAGNGAMTYMNIQSLGAKGKLIVILFSIKYIISFVRIKCY